jgi:hypothetical protein
VASTYTVRIQDEHISGEQFEAGLLITSFRQNTQNGAASFETNHFESALSGGREERWTMAGIYVPQDAGERIG